VCLRRGLGVTADDAAAERAYLTAALKGHSSAQLALGSLRAQSAQRESEWQDVAHWYRLAADAGHPTAMAMLAELHERGVGVSADPMAALALYRRAASAGHTDSVAAAQRLEQGIRPREPAA
jgi:uncharacterized protein